MDRKQAEILEPADMPEIVDVLTDAFAGYPVMSYVLGPDGDSVERLSTLIGFFVFRRAQLGGPMFGVRDERGRLVGAAVMTLPKEPEPTNELLERRDRVFAVLGEDCRKRHEAYAAVAKTVLITEPHHHLNMIGVRRGHHGRGFARPLLEAACDLAESDSTSAGLTLTTETPANVRLYQNFGFGVVRSARVEDVFETWGLFRGRLNTA